MSTNITISTSGNSLTDKAKALQQAARATRLTREQIARQTAENRRRILTDARTSATQRAALTGSPQSTFTIPSPNVLPFRRPELAAVSSKPLGFYLDATNPFTSGISGSYGTVSYPATNWTPLPNKGIAVGNTRGYKKTYWTGWTFGFDRYIYCDLPPYDCPPIDDSTFALYGTPVTDSSGYYGPVFNVLNTSPAALLNNIVERTTSGIFINTIVDVGENVDYIYEFARNDFLYEDFSTSQFIRNPNSLSKLVSKNGLTFELQFLFDGDPITSTSGNGEAVFAVTAYNKTAESTSTLGTLTTGVIIGNDNPAGNPGVDQFFLLGVLGEQRRQGNLGGQVINMALVITPDKRQYIYVQGQRLYETGPNPSSVLLDANMFYIELTLISRASESRSRIPPNPSDPIDNSYPYIISKTNFIGEAKIKGLRFTNRAVYTQSSYTPPASLNKFL